MTPIRVLIVDDEPLARGGLRQLLESDPELEVVGEAATADEAVDAIESLQPTLVTLDIQLPDGDGFDVIRRIGPDRMPLTVFVTAFNQYAVDAFEVNAVDYLLKPFDDDRFAVTIARAKKAVRQGQFSELSQKMAELLNSGVATRTPDRPAVRFIDRLVIKSTGRSFFVRADEIDWIEAADYYVKIHTGKNSHLLRESMNTLETRLDPGKFFRVHRSAIVNLDCVRELQAYFRGEHVVILRDGTKLKLSRARREKLEDALNQRL